LGDERWAAYLLGNLGIVARRQGKPEQALARYEESLALRRELGDRWGLAYLFEDLGWLLAQQSQGEEALVLVGAADTMRQEIGGPLTASESEKLNKALAEAIRPLSQEAQQAATQAGQTVTLSEAILYAFDRIDRETTG
jgi:tetratricopeptide (TPR) repeat protein